MEFYRVHDRLVVEVGDITRVAVDAIVNAANSSLMGGGGVDGAIHRAGGPRIIEQCRALREREFPGGLPTGEAAITSGGDLPAKRVIHTVGPIFGQHRGQEPVLLASCYRRCIEVAAAHGLQTLAFPAISTGVYGYPKRKAARVSREAIEAALARFPSIREVRVVFFSERDAAVFVEEIGPRPTPG